MNYSVLIPFQMSIYADNLSLEDASSDVYIPTLASLSRLTVLINVGRLKFQINHKLYISRTVCFSFKVRFLFCFCRATISVDG